MLVIPDYVYKFTFKSLLSVLNGIYKVLGVFSYSELFELNIDLFEVTYNANGLDGTIFEADINTIRSGEIIKIVSVDDSTIIRYIPAHMLAEIPDGSVNKYFNLGLAVNLGIFDDQDKLSTLKGEIEQIVSAMVGISDTTVIYTTKNTWMSVPEYQAIDATRNANISRISNHFVDKISLQKEIDSLRTKLNYYENALVSLTN
jgi:hypothetical protein